MYYESRETTRGEFRQWEMINAYLEGMQQKHIIKERKPNEHTYQRNLQQTDKTCH